MALSLETFSSAFATHDYRAPDGTEFALKAEQEGTFEVRSGAIVACDPLTFSNTRPFVRRVPPGDYPVWVTERDGEIACLSIVFQPTTRATTWVPAEMEGGGLAYGVDAGVGCFLDHAALAHFEAVAEEEADFDGGVEILGSDQGALVGCRSGQGDGVYASYWGLDEAGAPVALLTDFALVPWTLP